MNINYNNTALVLIDLQKGIVPRSFNPNEVINNSLKLIDLFRENKGTIVFVHVQNERINLPSDVEFISKLVINKEDMVILKSTPGAFKKTSLDHQLKNKGINKILLGGIATDIGVLQTAVEARELNYEVFFANEAMGALDEKKHYKTITSILPDIGQVINILELN